MKLFFVLLTLTSFLQGSEGQVEFEANLPRILTPNPSNELEATLTNGDGDLIGEALLTFDNDDMTIDIELDDLPDACDDGDCFIAIDRRSSCGTKSGKSAKSAKGSFYFDGGRSACDLDNPWTPFDSDFESDDGGASFDFITSNGKGYDDNKDRVMVIYVKKPPGPPVAHPKSSKKQKSKSDDCDWDPDDYDDFACGKLIEA